ncbi:MAG: ribosome silencing factor [Deltaproteobacteria bacterium]|nr:ribosome silencing factor [Deltaproteobacteria bacterium]
MTESESKQKARWLVTAALERKAERPIVLDMTNLTFYADTFILLTGRSDRQVRAIAEGVLEALRAHGETPIGTEGMDDGYWVLIDCNDTIVHVFDPEARDKFDLERLWQDAPRIDLGIAGVDPNPAPESPRSGEGDAADPAA